MTQDNMEQFDVIAFLDGLIEQMGLQNESPTELKALRENMSEALHNELFRAASENLEPEVIDAVLEDMKDEEDNMFILMELIKSSPGAQLAMVEAIENFKENTMTAFNKVKS